MREYGVSELTGKRRLLALHCDAPGCLATIAPHPEIARSGWRKLGVVERDGSSLVWDYCPDHADMARIPTDD